MPSNPTLQEFGQDVLHLGGSPSEVRVHVACGLLDGVLVLGECVDPTVLDLDVPHHHHDPPVLVPLPVLDVHLGGIVVEVVLDGRDLHALNEEDAQTVRLLLVEEGQELPREEEFGEEVLAVPEVAAPLFEQHLEHPLHVDFPGIVALVQGVLVQGGILDQGVGPLGVHFGLGLDVGRGLVADLALALTLVVADVVLFGDRGLGALGVLLGLVVLLHPALGRPVVPIVVLVVRLVAGFPNRFH